MKLNFRRIAAIGMSAMTLGLTAGVAAAAAAPQPFVSGSTGDFAVVYGSAAPSGLDQAQANDIADWLQGMTSGSISVEGGEAFMLDKTSNHLNMGNALNSVYTSLDDDEMVFLADGSYDDGSVDSDFTQSITLGNKALDLFADPDYNDDAPTIGFHWTNGQHILNYTIDFNDDVNYTEMVGTELPMLGGSYYVLAASTTQIDVLDTAEKTTLAIGESTTIGGKSVTLTFVDSDEVRFTVDGENTDLLSENEEYELDDGSYIIPTAISYQDYAGGVQSAEFSIGSGKLELIDGEEIEANTEDVDGLEVDYVDGTSSSFLDSLTIVWNSDEDTFLTESNSIAMPELGVIQLAFGGMNFPTPETIAVQNGDTLTLSMGNYDLPVAWIDSTGNATLGEEDHLLKVSASAYSYAALGFSNETTFWGADTSASNDSASVGTGLNLSEGERFIVTSLDADLSDIETSYYEVSNIDVDDPNTFIVELNDLIGTNDLKFENSINDTDDDGDITVTLRAFDATNTSAVLTFSSASGTISYNQPVSEKGMVVTLPTSVSDVGQDGAGQAHLNFTEADKDDDVNEGTMFSATFKSTTNDQLHVSTHNVTAYDEEESDDYDVGYIPSDLASKTMFDTSADENDFSIEYYGEEVYADVQVVAGGTVSYDASIGGVLVTDSEISSVQTRNLVVVGGSCINTVAANLVGGAYCGSAWTDATGIGEGQFLIQSFASDYQNGKIALSVAGYDASDTAAAASRLINQPSTINTAAGNKYLGVVGSAGTSTVTKVA